LVENIEALFTELNHAKDDIIRQYEKEILDLVFAIAGKIAHHQIRSNENAVKQTIINAMEMAAQRSKITVRVSPEDYDIVERVRPELFAEFKEAKSIIVSSDQSVSRGGCFLETPSGDVDATVEAQMEKIYQSLEEAFCANE
jgi:flagellar assembly protein FliH